MPFTQDAQQFPYDKSGVRVTYRWDNGTVLMPVTAPSPVTPTPAPPIMDQAGNNVGPNLNNPDGSPFRQPAVVVQLHAPCGSMKVEFHSQRKGQFTVQPTPVRDDPNAVLRTLEVWMDSPALDADQETYTTEAGGFYLYDLLQPLFPTDGLLPYGTPYDSATPAAMDKSYFQVLWWTPQADTRGEQRQVNPGDLNQATGQDPSDPDVAAQLPGS